MSPSHRLKAAYQIVEIGQIHLAKGVATPKMSIWHMTKIHQNVQYSLGHWATGPGSANSRMKSVLRDIRRINLQTWRQSAPENTG